MSFNIKTIDEFERSFRKLLKKYPSLKTDLQNLILDLEINPMLGVFLGNEFYKIRLSISSKGKGKLGGARIITCVKIVRQTIYLAAIYDKSEKETILDADLKLLAKQIT